MTTQTEALKLALEALDFSTSPSPCVEELQDDAIFAIKEALAQPEQEPVAIVHRNEYNEYRLEPHDNFDIKSIPFNIDVPLFKSPQRTWVGLTDEEIKKMRHLIDWTAGWSYNTFARAIEAKLKEKNA